MTARAPSISMEGASRERRIRTQLKPANNALRQPLLGQLPISAFVRELPKLELAWYILPA